jgi:hypothetical protein
MNNLENEKSGVESSGRERQAELSREQPRAELLTALTIRDSRAVTIAYNYLRWTLTGSASSANTSSVQILTKIHLASFPSPPSPNNNNNTIHSLSLPFRHSVNDRPPTRCLYPTPRPASYSGRRLLLLTPLPRVASADSFSLLFWGCVSHRQIASRPLSTPTDYLNLVAGNLRTDNCLI